MSFHIVSDIFFLPHQRKKNQIPSLPQDICLSSHLRDFYEYFTVYGLDRNKGYPTVEHIFSLNNTGVTNYHRKSFKIKNG